jgi:NAD(P)-dependent dehydrogenase (short-subunit alcohol dehydrogenase family)
MYDFSGKVALITGAAGNLGSSVAHTFHRSGARLVLVDLSLDGLRATYSAWAEQDDVLLLAIDLTDADAVQAMVDEAKARFGAIHILANIAGGFTMGPALHETPVRDWDFMLGLNTRTVFLTSRAVIPVMLEQGSGKIVSVSARAAREGKPKMGPYCVSKAAVITLTETLAAEHKYNGINVNCILPGTIDTPQNRQAMPDADHSRWVTPQDLANVILFLACEEARAVTGAAVPVFGQS